MKQILTFILGLIGVDVGSGFLVLVQRLTIRWLLVSTAVLAFALAYYACRTTIINLLGQAQTSMTADLTSSELGPQVMAWTQCMVPASAPDAFSVLFSAYAAIALLNFYWQVLKMKSTGF